MIFPPADFVDRPLPTNLVLPSTMNIISFPPDVTVSDVPDTALTGPEAVIVFDVAAFWACTAIGWAAMQSTTTESATSINRFISPPSNASCEFLILGRPRRFVTSLDKRWVL